jgi:DNA end-binding protein Ku
VRAVWRGTLLFGLIAIPVRLVTAQERRPVGFRTLSRRTGAPIRHRRWDPVLDEEVRPEDVLRGVEVEPGRFATFEPEELERLRAPAPEAPPPPRAAPAPAPAEEPEEPEDEQEPEPPEEPEPAPAPPPPPRTIELSGFVPLPDVDPVLYERAYWVTPDRVGARPYAILAHALETSARAAVGRLVLARRERLVMVRAQDEMLVLHTLLWPEDVRQADRNTIQADVREVQVREQELAMAVQLVENLSRPFDPEEHRDPARIRLLAAIRERAGEAVPAPPAAADEEVAPPADLMAALKASLEAVGAIPPPGGRDGRGRASA